MRMRTPLPLTASVAAHAAALAALVWLAALLPPRPLLPSAAPKPVGVLFLPPPAPPAPPRPQAQPAAEPPPAAAPAAAAPPPPAPVHPRPRVAERPKPPHPERDRVRRPEPPAPSYAYRPAEPPPAAPANEPQWRPPPAYSYRPAPPQVAAAVPVPAPAPRAAAVVSAGYRAALGSWLEAHKRYPEAARDRGEEGQAVIRFQVARDGSLLGFSLSRSTGHPDLDAAIGQMMRGARLPPFPPDMTASSIDVSVAVNFALER